MGVNPYGGNPVIPAQLQFAPYELTSTPTQLEFANDFASGPYIFACTQEIIAPAPDLILMLPNGIEGSVGIAGNIINKGSYPFAVLDYDENILLILYPVTDVGAGEFNSVQFYLVDNSTSPGTWHYLINGAANSSISATELAGYGLEALIYPPDSSLRLNTNSLVVGSTGDFAVDQTYRGSVINAITGETCTLANPVLTNGFYFDLLNNTPNNFEINPNGLMINNSTDNLNMVSNTSARIVSDGTNYWAYNLATLGTSTSSIIIFDVSAGGVFPISSALASQYSTFIFIGALVGSLTVLFPPTLQGEWVVSNYTTGFFNMGVAQNDGSGSVQGSVFLLPQSTTRSYINVTETSGAPLSSPTLLQISGANDVIPLPIISGGSGTTVAPTKVGQTLFSNTLTQGLWGGFAIRQIVDLLDTTHQDLSGVDGIITTYTVSITLTATNSRVFLIGNFAVENNNAASASLAYFLQQNGVSVCTGAGGNVNSTGTLNFDYQDAGALLQGPVQHNITYLTPILAAGTYIYTVRVNAATTGANCVYYNRSVAVDPGTVEDATPSTLYAIEIGGF